MTIPMRPTVNIQQAMALCQVSRRTLYHWMDAGKVEFIRTAGGRRRIYTDTLFRTDHPTGRTGHVWTSETAPRAGRKGGLASAAKRAARREVEQEMEHAYAAHTDIRR